MGWFGPSKEDVWRQLSNEIGAEFIGGGFWKGNKVEAHVAPWTITLDTYTVSTGHSQITYTRMRAPYINPDGLRFTLYRKGFFSDFAKLLGMQDIEVGDFEFDDAFIIKGTDEMKIRELFADARLRALVQAQPTIRLSVMDDEGWFGTRFPKGVDELHFQVVGVIADLGRLKALFDLFSVTLDRLCQVGSGRKEEPGVVL
jgi:hypothetical protein